MTEYQVELSRTAQADILGIIRYIRTELGEPQIAGTMYGLLKEHIRSLASLPERSAVVDIPKLGVRRLPVKNYSVFYLADSTRQVVHIVRVMYSGRNIASQLLDTSWNE